MWLGRASFDQFIGWLVGNHAQRELDRYSKKATLSGGSCKLIAASCYSPTPSPGQYHRRCGALYCCERFQRCGFRVRNGTGHQRRKVQRPAEPPR
jgi:hypothetical protein